MGIKLYLLLFCSLFYNFWDESMASDYGYDSSDYYNSFEPINCSSSGGYYNPFEHGCTAKVGEIKMGVFKDTHKISYRPEVDCPRNGYWERVDRDLMNWKCLCGNVFCPTDTLLSCAQMWSRRNENECPSFHGRTNCEDPGKLETCKCPEGSVWNSTANFCFSEENCDLLSEREHTIYDLNEQICIHEINDPCKPSSFRFKCPENSQCKSRIYISEYICQCNDGFFLQSGERNCQPKRMIGEVCKDDDMCAEPLICHPNKPEKLCACPIGTVWDEKDKLCYGTLGSSCYTSFGGKTLPCAPGSKCVPERQGYCKCNEGYKENISDGKCYGRIGANCQKNKDCSTSLACFNGKCVCADLSSALVGKDGNCGIYAGGICNEDTSICTENSECVNGTCTCISGYDISSSRRCLKGFNETCTESECNYEEGLGCSEEGKCTCIGSNLAYIPGKGCSGQRGSLCGARVMDYHSGNNYFINNCSEGFVCKMHGQTVQPVGICEEPDLNGHSAPPPSG